MVIADDANNNFDASTLRTVSIEYNIIPSGIHQYSQIYTNSDDNRLPAMSPTICTHMLVHCNPLVCMVIVEVGSNNYEGSTLRTVSREYNRILQITPLISNLHRMGGK
jgi:hypothetical protein